MRLIDSLDMNQIRVEDWAFDNTKDFQRSQLKLTQLQIKQPQEII